MNDLHILLQVLLLFCSPSTLLSQALSTGGSLIVQCTHKHLTGDVETGIFFLKFQARSNVDNATDGACLMCSLSGSATSDAKTYPNCGYDSKQLDLKTENYSRGIMKVAIHNVNEHNFGTYHCEWKNNVEHGDKGNVEEYKSGTVKFNAINVMCYIHYTIYDSSGNLTLDIMFSQDRPECEVCWKGHVTFAVIPSGIITIIFLVILFQDWILEKFSWLKNKISRFRNSS